MHAAGLVHCAWFIHVAANECAGVAGEGLGPFQGWRVFDGSQRHISCGGVYAAAGESPSIPVVAIVIDDATSCTGWEVLAAFVDGGGMRILGDITAGDG